MNNKSNRRTNWTWRNSKRKTCSVRSSWRRENSRPSGRSVWRSGSQYHVRIYCKSLVKLCLHDCVLLRDWGLWWIYCCWHGLLIVKLDVLDYINFYDNFLTQISQLQNMIWTMRDSIKYSTRKVFFPNTTSDFHSLILHWIIHDGHHTICCTYRRWVNPFLSLLETWFGTRAPPHRNCPIFLRTYFLTNRNSGHATWLQIIYYHLKLTEENLRYLCEARKRKKLGWPSSTISLACSHSFSRTLALPRESVFRPLLLPYCFDTHGVSFFFVCWQARGSPVWWGPAVVCCFPPSFSSLGND